MSVIEEIRKFFKPFLPVEAENFDALAPLELPIKIFSHFRLWSIRRPTRSFIVTGIILHLIFSELCILLQLLYLPIVEDFMDFTVLMSILPSCIGVCIQSIVLVTKRSDIDRLIAAIRSCIEEIGMDEQFKRQVMRIDKIFKLLFANCIATFITFAATSVFARELVTKMWMPFDTDAGYNFWINAGYQIMAVYYTGPLSMVLDLFPVFFLVYTSCMLTQLCQMIEDDGKATKRQKLINCVNYHLKVLGIVGEIRRIFSLSFMSRGFLTILILCTNVFSLVILTDAAIAGKLISYILIELSQIFLTCYYGSQIEATSSKIKDTLFHCDWMSDDDGEYRRLVIIMMEASKRPVKVSVFGVFDVNLETYKVICRSAYSMYCLCIEVVKKYQ